MKRKIVAEALGTAFLLAAVVGSGIMGDRLSQGNVAIALLVNTIATGATLAALILTFSSISGAHFNPAVTLAAASLDEMPWKQVPSYIAAQNRRSAERCRYRTHHVWAAPVLELSSCKARLRTRIQRICRHLWIAQCDLGLQPISLLGSCLCCRRIYYRRLLVHGVHLFCQSGSYFGAFAERYVRRNSAIQWPCFYCGTVAGSRRCHGAVSLAYARKIFYCFRQGGRGDCKCLNNLS